MSDWQPGRFRLVHKRPTDKSLWDNPDTVSSDELAPLVLMVREQPFRHVNEILVAAMGCDAQKFYDVQGQNCIICEHEILTD